MYVNTLIINSRHNIPFNNTKKNTSNRVKSISFYNLTLSQPFVCNCWIPRTWVYRLQWQGSNLWTNSRTNMVFTPLLRYWTQNQTDVVSSLDVTQMYILSRTTHDYKGYVLNSFSRQYTKVKRNSFYWFGIPGILLPPWPTEN